MNQGLLAFDSDWHPVQNALTRALDGVPVQSLMVDSRGRLWCGTYSELGLVRYDTGSGELVFLIRATGWEARESAWLSSCGTAWWLWERRTALP